MLRKAWFELVAGGLLAASLLLVFLYDRGAQKPISTKPEPISGAQGLEVRVVRDQSGAEEQKRLRLAVVHPDNKEIWDDMGKLLQELGEGYKFERIEEKLLRDNPALLDRSRFDVVFLTCNNADGSKFKDRLYEFVNEGGVLYASDLRFVLLMSTFPAFVDKNLDGQGSKQDLLAEVLDPELRELVGPTIDLRFDQDGWVPAAFGGQGVTPLVEGVYKRYAEKNKPVSPETARAPLLVQFQVGKGTVIFTSFHNEKINSAIEKKLLEYLVFKTVLPPVIAASEEGGLSTARSSMVGMAGKNPSFSRTHKKQKAGPLRFALDFRNEGARVQLVIEAPNGRKHTWEGDAAVLLEIPQAAPGQWTYTVTALKLPYDNFPFRVSVSEKK